MALRLFLDRLCSSFATRFHNRINLWQTFLFNFRAFPVRIAVKFPVYVYGKVNIIHVGDIVLNSSQQRGMIHIGENFYKSHTKLFFNNWGVLRIGNNVVIRSGVDIFNRGEIFFGENVEISENSFISISSLLVIDNNTSIGYSTSIVDTDDHYMLDMKSLNVSNNTKSIRIGCNCWIGSNTYIKKGAILPDFITIASPNALVAKDYSFLEPDSILAGAPASLIKKGYRRVMNKTKERELISFFSTHEEDYVLSLSEIKNLHNMFNI